MDDSAAILPSSNAKQPCLKKHDFIGGPIPFVSLSFAKGYCVYGKGPYLVVASLFHPEKEGCKERGAPETKLLIFDNPGQNVHGMDWCTAQYNARSNKDDAEHLQDRTSLDNYLAVVHGGRHAAFVLKKQKSTDPDTEGVFQKPDLQLVPILLADGTQDECLKFSDWIWNCMLVYDELHSRFIMYTGMAHNAIEVWAIELVPGQQPLVRCQKEHRYDGTRRCISYSLCFWRAGTQGNEAKMETNDPTQVAVGLVTNEILMWSVPPLHVKSSQEGSTTVIAESQCLRGHQGVIHAIKFNKRGNLLASASDDRSIRLWEKTQQKTSGVQLWVSKWIGWGHTARCWNVTFFQNNDNHCDEALLCSCSEDGTVRLWSTATGDSAATLYGSSGGSYWSIDCDETLAATGGNDGTVHLYNILSRLDQTKIIALFGDKDGKFGVAMDAYNSNIGRFRRTTIVPDDRRPVITEDESQVLERASVSKKKKKKKVIQQTLVGTEFVTHDNCDFLRVATRDGSLMELDLASFEWYHRSAWWNPNTKICNGIEPTDGCCLASLADASHTIFAIGTTQGHVALCLGADRIILEGSGYKTVQKLRWLDHSMLIVYHVQAVRTWVFSEDILEHEDLQSAKATAKSYTYIGSEKTVVSCAEFNPTKSMLAMGNSRGILNLFEVPTTCADEVSSSSWLRLHKKEHINDIVWASDDHILSVGNDGYFRESKVENKHQLVEYLSVPIRTFTAIDRIVCRDSRGPICLGGYNGNNYMIIDYKTGYEFYRTDTGGRGRSLALSHAPFNFETSRLPLMSCVSAMRKDGLNDLIVESQSVMPAFSAIQRQPIQSCVGAILHNETLFDVDFARCERGQVALVSASEDCSSRLTVWAEDGSLVQQAIFPPQESGVRAVCCTALPSNKSRLFVVEGGSKLALRFYLVCIGDGTEFNIKVIATGSQPEHASIDHRINAVATTSIGDDGSAQLAVSGDSNGNVYAYRVHLFRPVHERLPGRLLFNDARPILAVETVRCTSSCCYLVVGTSSGEVCILDVSFIMEESKIPERDEKSQILYRFKAHSVGTNCIESTNVRTSSSYMSFRICSGGDDQSLSYLSIEVAIDSHGKGTLKPTFSHPQNRHRMQASISAVRGISWLDEDHVVCSGYGQRVSVWRFEEGIGFTLVCVVDTEVGDVNSLASVAVSANKYLITVVGIGAQVFLFEISHRGMVLDRRTVG